MIAKLGPPARPLHPAIDVVTMSTRDIAQLAQDAALMPVAPEVEWQDIADRLSFAFCGYAAGVLREAVEPGNTTLRDWGAGLKADALRLLARVGIEADDDTARQGAWRSTELASAALACTASERGPEAAVLVELGQHMQGMAERRVDPAPVETAEDINLLLQRAIFNLVPTLKVLAMAGEAVEQTYGGAVRRGGRVAGRSIPWLFQEIVASFRLLHGIPPNITPPGGRGRSPRDLVHLVWFRCLFQMIALKAAEADNQEAVEIRDIAGRCLDADLAERNYDRLRTWIIAAVGKE